MSATPAPIPDARPASTSWRGLVALFFGAWFLLYANRTLLAPMMAVLGAEWGLSEGRLGLLVSAFYLAYTAAQLPAGWLAARIGDKRLLVPTYLMHGVGALLGGFAPGPSSLLLLRVGTGLAQSGFYAPHMAIATRALPADRRAFGTTVMTSGFGFGLAAGSAVAGWMIYGLGLSWRVPFWLFGAGTIAVAAAMHRWVPPDRPVAAPDRISPPPDRVPAPPERARPQPAAAVAVASDVAGRHPAREPFHFPLWLLVHHLTMYGMYVVLSWLPYYLQTERGIPGTEASAALTVLPLVSLPAGLLLARLSDRSGSRQAVLLWLTPLAGLALLGIAWLPGRAGLYGSLILYAVAGKLVFDPLMMAWLADRTPPERYSQTFAVANFAVTTAMVVAPALAGFIREWSGSFATAFYVVAALQGAAWLLLRAISRR